MARRVVFEQGEDDLIPMLKKFLEHLHDDDEQDTEDDIPFMDETEETEATKDTESDDMAMMIESQAIISILKEEADEYRTKISVLKRFFDRSRDADVSYLNMEDVADIFGWEYPKKEEDETA